jgi:hypothetical protein
MQNQIVSSYKKEFIPLNVYSFHATITSKADKRERVKQTFSQEGASLNAAWTTLEEKLVKKFPNETVVLSSGNRQPLALRPGFKATRAKEMAMAAE